VAVETITGINASLIVPSACQQRPRTNPALTMRVASFSFTTFTQRQPVGSIPSKRNPQNLKSVHEHLSGVVVLQVRSLFIYYIIVFSGYSTAEPRSLHTCSYCHCTCSSPGRVKNYAAIPRCPRKRIHDCTLTAAQPALLCARRFELLKPGVNVREPGVLHRLNGRVDDAVLNNEV
jgi:hypothetical protein